MLFFPVRQPSRYVVYVKFRFVFEHAMPERHFKTSTRTVRLLFTVSLTYHVFSSTPNKSI